MTNNVDQTGYNKWLSVVDVHDQPLPVRRLHTFGVEGEIPQAFDVLVVLPDGQLWAIEAGFAGGLRAFEGSRWRLVFSLAGNWKCSQYLISPQGVSMLVDEYKQ